MAKLAGVASFDQETARHRHGLTAARHYRTLVVDDLQGVKTCPEVSRPHDEG